MKLTVPAFILFCSLATPAIAQERDAHVLPPGRLRIAVGAEYDHLNSEFGAVGRVPFDGGYGGALTPQRFDRIAPFAVALGTFFDNSAAHGGGGAADPGALSAGSLAVELGWNTRTVPFGVSLGVFPRVEIGARMNVLRNERFPRRFQLTAGNLGVNPDTAGNAALMGSISSAYSSLGGAQALPIEDSPLGAELQHRVMALTGQQLSLPTTPLTPADLQSLYGINPVPYLLGEWRPGDLEIEARVALFRNFAGFHPSAAAGLWYRVAASGGLRLGTGRRGTGNPLVEAGPEVGFAGGSAGISADLFIAERVWISGSGEFRRFGARSVLRAAVPAEGPYAGEVTFGEVHLDRGDELDFRIVPRLLLTSEFSIGLRARSEHWRQGEYRSEAGNQTIPATSRQSLGFGFRYSTLPRAERGERILPLEAEIGFAAAVRGSASVPASRTAAFEVRLFPRIWGD